MASSGFRTFVKYLKFSVFFKVYVGVYVRVWVVLDFGSEAVLINEPRLTEPMNFSRRSSKQKGK